MLIIKHATSGTQPQVQLSTALLGLPSPRAQLQLQVSSPSFGFSKGKGRNWKRRGTGVRAPLCMIYLEVRILFSSEEEWDLLPKHKVLKEYHCASPMQWGPILTAAQNKALLEGYIPMYI